MIRRKAKIVSNGTLGFVLAWLLKLDQGSESLVFVFEISDGIVVILPTNEVQFMDGSPDVIVEMK